MRLLTSALLLMIASQAYAVDPIDRRVCLAQTKNIEKELCLRELEGVKKEHCKIYSNPTSRQLCEADYDKFEQITDPCRKDFECYSQQVMRAAGSNICGREEKDEQDRRNSPTLVFDMRIPYPDDTYIPHGWKSPGAGTILLKGLETGRMYIFYPSSTFCDPIY